MTDIEDPRIAFIGGGNMARSLIGALIQSGHAAARLRVSEPNEELRDALTLEFGILAFDNANEACSDAAIVLIAVKPQLFRVVCAELATALGNAKPLIISIAAGITISQIDEWLDGGNAIVRCMPNTPSLIGAGATGLHANAAVNAEQRMQAEAILGSAGITEWIADESLIDVVTALSGSGPAYFFLLVEALENAAVEQGLPRDAARALAAHTCLGAGRMLVESGESPETLRKRVTSPNGTTHAAITAFEIGGLRELAADAVAAATERGRELAAQGG
ncbi:MAG: pyrroline-5-carboxylate reductase [Dokdonella sp.]